MFLIGISEKNIYFFLDNQPSEKNTWLGLRRNQSWNMHTKSVRGAIWCGAVRFWAIFSTVLCGAI